ncbi:glycosyl transferase [Streptomyces violaceusniger]|uniref:Nucleotide disphospho-sugar-binding domain-containing protein n=2 Tax=Streptomyces violaceusniger group TaxID=2839105 RepID=A0ABD5J3Y7_9ACTN|nr:nucleotide disphospho-sugar-binding domain-containing protein [Streptomyces violaceusniger]KUL66963.1 glycosyl transferase [Streptomyces violaceusniger]MEE4582501.1 nucleotide disphospho-sugar-binding domain-containing protein [Streptomyces sp. DSM 41602]
MRVLFTTWASGAHLVPMVPLARALLGAGHQVRVAVPSECAAAVARTGLVPVQIGALPMAVVRAPDATRRPRGIWPTDWPVRPSALTPEQHGVLRALGDRQVRIAEAMAQGLVAFARCWQPELVVHDASAYAGTVAAGALGVPAIGQLWGSAAVLRLDRQRLEGPPLPGYARLMRRYGADPAREPDLWLDPCPPSLALPSRARRLPVRLVPHDGPSPHETPPPYEARRAGPHPARQAAASNGRRGPGGPRRSGPVRVCAAWDDASGPPDAVRAALWAAEARGVEVVRVGSAAEGRPPAGPLHRVLPGCRALLHQGGGAAVLAAATAGVPQLVVAPRLEQQLNGARLAWAGAGIYLPADALDGTRRGARAVGGRLALDLFALLEQPSYAAAAHALRREALAMPGPDKAVLAVTRLTGPAA